MPIEESLRKKLELICEFAKTTPTIINRNIRKIDRTNLTYIEPNRIIIKNKKNKIKTLTENNEALELRLETLNKNNKVKDRKIDILKEYNKYK